MTLDILQSREHGIEAQWARERDEELIQKLRERAKIEEISRVLARKLRADDPALRRRILHLGVTHDTGPALFLLPLVQVAWADGKVTDEERETIMGLAAFRGVRPGSPVYAQVLEWFRTPPAQEFFDAALEVIRLGISVLPDEEREDRIAAYALSYRRVAEASAGRLGAFFGLAGPVSPEAEAIIDRNTATLRG